jgi:hypothetical protein
VRQRDANFFDQPSSPPRHQTPGLPPHVNGEDKDPNWLDSLAASLADGPESPEDILHAPIQTHGPALWVINQAWASADIPRRPWIARGYLMRGAVTVLSGPGSAGKSSMIVAWASCATTGSSFRNFKVTSNTRFAVYNVEDDADEQKRRFSAMFQRLGLTPDAFQDRLAIIGPTEAGQLIRTSPGGGTMVSTEAMDEIERFFETFKPDVACFDPFVELHDADENDNTAVRAVMAFLRRMAARHNCSVLVLHHSRKGVGDPGDPDSLRGASAIVGAARVVLTINVMSKEEAKSFGIPEERRRTYFRLDGAKSNYAPIEEAEWFERQEMRLDNDSDGEPADGVAVAWPWKPPSTFADASPVQINQVLDILNAPPDGWLYAAGTGVGSNSSRWVGTVLIRELGCTDEQAKAMIKAWLKSGLLYEEDYHDTEQRKKKRGVRVNSTKRPS